MYQKIARMLKQYIPSNEREIAIFPYGYHGQMIHHMLKDLYGINDVILIDNGLAEINPERFHKSKDILPRGGGHASNYFEFYGNGLHRNTQ